MQGSNMTVDPCYSWITPGPDMTEPDCSPSSINEPANNGREAPRWVDPSLDSSDNNRPQEGAIPANYQPPYNMDAHGSRHRKREWAPTAGESSIIYWSSEL